MIAIAVDMLAAVRAAGGDVKLAGPGRLKVVAPMPLSDELIEQLRTAKPDLLTLLSEARLAWTDAHEERAAVAEFDGEAPRAWAEALARLDPACPPKDVPAEYWLRFVNACGRFLDDGWHEKAAALGWGPLELFGCDRNHPFGKVEAMGLLWRIGDYPLVALTRDNAFAATPNGGVHHLRRCLPGQVLVWELAGEYT